MAIKPTHILDEKYVFSLQRSKRAQKVDAERHDLAIVAPALTWLMRNASGKWVKLPNDIPDTPKDISNARKHDRKAALAAIDRLNGPPQPEPIPDPDAPKTLRDALEGWRQRQYYELVGDEPPMRDSSRKTYGFWLRHIETWEIDGRLALDVLLDKITDIDCGSLQRKLANRKPTANKVIKRLSEIFKFAQGKRWTKFNPAIALKPLKHTPRRPRLTQAEFDVLYPAIWAELDPAKWPILLAFNTSARLKEAALITPDEIDVEAGTWTIPGSRSKNHKAHIKYLKSTQQIMIARNAAGWKTDKDKYSAVRNLFNKLRKRHGVQQCGLHALRRYLAKRTKDQFGLEAARQLLGHASDKQTEVYTEGPNEELLHTVTQAIANELNFKG
jgi:integrase